MLPTLWPGDFLTIQSRSPEEIVHGEIILYMREGRFFVHRVKSTSVVGDQTFLIVRGDCMPDDDPPVRSNEVLGKIVGVQRAGSSFVPACKLSPFRKTVAYMLCHWNLFRQVGLRIWTRCQQGDAQILTAFVKAAS
jgi:signal peptidase I